MTSLRVQPFASLPHLNPVYDENRFSHIARLYAFGRNDVAVMRRAVTLAAQPESWRKYFAERAARAIE